MANSETNQIKQAHGSTISVNTKNITGGSKDRKKKQFKLCHTNFEVRIVNKQNGGVNKTIAEQHLKFKAATCNTVRIYAEKIICVTNIK